MSIEDTFGYRFVRTSLVMLNCIVLLRLLSLLLQYSHKYEPTFVLFVIFIGSNFMIAIIGAIREHRVSVILTGSITLVMFLSHIFTAKENKGVNIFLLILLAIAVQSLIFSEMLKERQIVFAQRRGLNLVSSLNTGVTSQNRNVNRGSNNTNGHLAAVVVYQTQGSARPSGALFMVDPEIGSELAKDPPPSYFASNCPPPKYEDAIKLNANDLSLPAVSGVIADIPPSSTDQSFSTPTSSLPSSSVISPIHDTTNTTTTVSTTATTTVYTTARSSVIETSISDNSSSSGNDISEAKTHVDSMEVHHKS